MKLNYFNFKKFNNKYLLTNDFGNYCFIAENDLKSLVKKEIDANSDLANMLVKNRMIYFQNNLDFSATNKYDMRESKAYVSTSTSLHIFVVTTACNMSCVYCQANNGAKCSNLYMNELTAKKAVDVALQSPSYDLSFEFQGGEPLLNFDIIKYIIEYAEQNKGNHCINYNLVSNLTLLTDDIVDFLKKYCVGVSTSLDGPEELHNSNRPFFNGGETWNMVVAGVKKLREAGCTVGAIQTTTKESLKYPREIVRTYSNMGFNSIFLRPLTPLGKATCNWDDIGYSPDMFVEFYKEALDELMKINMEGHFIKEDHASIFLRKIDGQFVNYMELRSPCGAGLGQLAYYPDGNVFTCDEGRMVYEMGADTFKLGSVFKNSFTDMVGCSVCKTVCKASILETIPTCCDCVYQPYCGTCPVINYDAYDDVIEKQPRGYRCKIYSGILDCIFELLMEESKIEKDILIKWGN